MTLHDAVQAFLFIVGVSSRWVLGRGTKRAVQASIWLQVINLPAWFYVAHETSSWGLAALNVVYGVLYFRALVNVKKVY